MAPDDPTQLSLLLKASAAGDHEASALVYDLLYDELRADGRVIGGAA